MLVALQYVGLLVVVAAALITLVKEWDDLTSRIRRSLLALTLLGGGVSAVAVYVSEREAEVEAAEAAAEYASLLAAEERTRQIFAKQNEGLLSRVIELEAKVTNEALLKELADTRAHLEETRAALAPKPAELVIAFENPAEVLFKVVNVSPNVAEEAEYHVRLSDIDLPEKQFLQILVGPIDYVGAKRARGPWSLKSLSAESESIEEGHRISGTIWALCRNCPRVRQFAIQYTHGVGGWSAELTSEEATVMRLARASQLWELVSRIPEGRRRPVPPQRRLPEDN